MFLNIYFLHIQNLYSFSDLSSVRRYNYASDAHVCFNKSTESDEMLLHIDFNINYLPLGNPVQNVGKKISMIGDIILVFQSKIYFIYFQDYE